MPIMMDTDFKTRAAMTNLATRTIEILGRFDMLPRDKDALADAFLISMAVCHTSGCALDFESMQAASDGEVLHDVCGIRANLNQRNGQLENDFLPRYTMTQRKQTMDEHEAVDRLNARNRARALS